MKTITFESIRNLLRSKKKSSQDYGDASFKRSDSFKRISIRRSYLNRNRKRALYSSKVANAGGHSNANASNDSQNHEATVNSVQEQSQHQESQSQNSHHEHEIQTYADIDVNFRNNSHIQNEPVYMRVSGSSIEIDALDRSSKNKLNNKKMCDLNDRIHRNSKRRQKPIRHDQQQHEMLESNLDGNASVRCQRHLNRMSNSKKNQCENDSKQMITSSGCFVKAGNRLKKPIGTGLDVTTEETIAQLPTHHEHNEKYSSHEKLLDDLRIDEHSNSTNDLNVDNRHFWSLDNEIMPMKSMPRFQQSISSTYTDTIAAAISSTSQINKNGIDSQKFNERPSFVIFKTYSNEHNPGECSYLETCFNNTKDHNTKILDSSIPIQIVNSASNQNAIVNLSNSKKHNHSNVYAKSFPSNDLQNKQKNKGVVIQISDSGCNIDNLNEFASINDKEQNRKQTKLMECANIIDVNDYDCSDDETSLNGKFTFEIYKQIKTAQKFETSSSSNTKNTDRDEINLYKQTAKDQTLDDTFRSLCLSDEGADANFFLEPNLNVASESPIPYPLRIKTNPFTNQKEPYSVNLGRVWKQLNLGQDDQSLETSINTQYKSQTNTKQPKNDSFRSISSHDSGFSLTLTKRKNFFHRKPPKKPHRKSKMNVTRDNNNLKKLNVLPNVDQSIRQTRTSINNRKKQQFKQRTCPSSLQQLQPFQELKKQNFVKSTLPSIEFGNNSDDQHSDEKPVSDKNCLQDNRNDSDISFSQEISDLEVFFEEHLKRLKEYYLHKKKINEQTIDEMYGDGENSKNKRCNKAPSTVSQCEKKKKRKKVKSSMSFKNKSNFHSHSRQLNANDSHSRKDSKQPSESSIKSKQRNDRKYIHLLSNDLWYRANSNTNNQSLFDNYDFPRPDRRSKIPNCKNSMCPLKETATRARSDIINTGTVQYASLDFKNDNMLFNQFPGPKNRFDVADAHSCQSDNNSEFCDRAQSIIVNCNKSVGDYLIGNSDDEYEDIPSDEYDEYNEFINFDHDVCVKCNKLLTECDCSVNHEPDVQPISPIPCYLAHYVTSDNLLCNCMGNIKTTAKTSSKNSHRAYKQASYTMQTIPKTIKRNKRRIRYLTKNHSLRRDYCYISSK